MRVLDTNAVIMLLADRLVPMRQRFRAHIRAGEPIAVPVVALFELHYGIERSARAAANTEALRHFLSQGIEVLAFDAHDGVQAARIRVALERVGTPIGPYDTLIAAQALRRGAVLVTANTREFSRVDGLALENWSAA